MIHKYIFLIHSLLQVNEIITTYSIWIEPNGVTKSVLSVFTLAGAKNHLLRVRRILVTYKKWKSKLLY